MEVSYWEWTGFLSPIDFLVVGGGIVGISAALRLRELAPEARIAIVDRGPLPLGASTRNAGFACFGSMTELLDDLTHTPEDEVWALVERRYRGLSGLLDRYGPSALGYEPLGGYEIFRPDEREVLENCLAHLPDFNRRLADLIGEREVYSLVDPAAAARFGLRDVDQLILNRAEGQLDTGKLMRSLLTETQRAGIDWFGGLTVTDWTETAVGVELNTDRGYPLRCRQLLIATNGFAADLLPDWEVVPARNQVLVTQPIPGLKIEGSFHYDRGYYYFRNVDQRILLGGGRHLNFEGEQTTDMTANVHIRVALLRLLRDVILPDQAVAVDRWWTGILGVGGRKAPLIQACGQHSVAAVRLGGMGVAIGNWVGREGAELLLNGRR